MFEQKKRIVDSLPRGWVIMSPGKALDFDVKKLMPRPVLKAGERRVDIEEVSRRAENFNGYLGLDAGDRIIQEQEILSVAFRSFYIVLPAVDLRGPRGARDILCLGFRDGWWGPCFGRLGGTWQRGVRLACRQGLRR